MPPPNDRCRAPHTQSRTFGQSSTSRPCNAFANFSKAISGPSFPYPAPSRPCLEALHRKIFSFVLPAHMYRLTESLKRVRTCSWDFAAKNRNQPHHHGNKPTDFPSGRSTSLASPIRCILEGLAKSTCESHVRDLAYTEVEQITYLVMPRMCQPFMFVLSLGKVDFGKMFSAENLPIA